MYMCLLAKCNTGTYYTLIVKINLHVNHPSLLITVIKIMYPTYSYLCGPFIKCNFNVRFKPIPIILIALAFYSNSSSNSRGAISFLI